MAEEDQAKAAEAGPQGSGSRSAIKQWKEWTLLAILVLFVLVLAAVFLTREGKKGPRPGAIREGSTAPDFALPALNGTYVSLSDQKGKVVLVHFWATWCPPCVEEMPDLERLYQEFRGPDFEVLAISVDEEGPGKVRAFMQKNRLSFPALMDPGRSVASSYGTLKYPETFIVDRSGVVRHRAIGSWDWNQPVNREKIRKLLGTR